MLCIISFHALCELPLYWFFVPHHMLSERVSIVGLYLFPVLLRPFCMLIKSILLINHALIFHRPAHPVLVAVALAVPDAPQPVAVPVALPLPPAPVPVPVALAIMLPLPLPPALPLP
jgi:hypothetical protein